MTPSPTYRIRLEIVDRIPGTVDRYTHSLGAEEFDKLFRRFIAGKGRAPLLEPRTAPRSEDR